MLGTHIDSFDADVMKEIAIDRHRNRTGLAERSHMRDDEMRIESLVSRGIGSAPSARAPMPINPQDLECSSLHFTSCACGYPVVTQIIKPVTHLSFFSNHLKWLLAF